MKNISIKNLRSLADTGPVTINPLTILLGKNSAGKSTFLRSFPLLRQSSEQKTINDILWFGEYVDFGSFSESLRRDADTSEIAFEFDLEVPLLAAIGRSRWAYNESSTIYKLAQNTNQRYKFTLKQIVEGKPGEQQTLSEYVIEAEGNTAKIVLEEDLTIRELIVNSNNISSYIEGLRIFRQSHLLPDLNIFYGDASPFELEIVRTVRPLVHHKVSDEDIMGNVGSLKFGPPEFLLSQLRALDLGVTWSRGISNWTKNSHQVSKINSQLFANEIDSIFEVIGVALSTTFSNSRYITPLRASAERYYRSQGLAVDEIAPNGENLAMYLKSLPTVEAQEFAEWTAEHMGFSVRTEDHRGHVSIVIENPADRTRTNLADVGFGYSQVIPILAQLWQLKNRKIKGYAPARFLMRYPVAYTPKIFLIEQPELHLHPSMQGKLAELLYKTIATANAAGVDLRIIVETHSETIIAKIGQMIMRNSSDSSLRADQVSVYLFDRQEGNSADTVIRQSGFDSEGYLENWPYDFFDGLR